MSSNDKNRNNSSRGHGPMRINEKPENFVLSIKKLMKSLSSFKILIFVAVVLAALSSVFGCLPITSFSQNVGLVAMTKVVNRFAIATGAIIMIIAGIFPFFGALLATLPDAVLGGCTLMMFGTIVISGLQMISNCGYSQRNITIAALSLSIGIGFTQVPEIFSIFPKIIENVFAENCVAVVFIVSIILNLVLPKNMETVVPKEDNENK